MVRRLAFALTLLALAGCGSPARPVHVRPPVTPEPAGPAPERGLPPDRFAADRALRAAAALRLRQQIAAARTSPTVEAALRVARLTGRISEVDEARDRRDWAAANATLAKLPGIRGSELGYVVGSVRALAAAHLLTSDRIDPTFLSLRDNAHFWATAALPAPGFRTTFGADPAIFQYYPGRGLQLQPLASWGRANALAGACLKALRSHTRKDRCRAAALTRSLDGLSALAAHRSGYLAWEYYFAYGSGAPPWVSGMAQATAAQALSRGYRALGRTRWRRTALRALGAFEQSSPAGVRVGAPSGNRYALYSFSPGYHVLNGELQAVIGLRDTAALTGSRRAEQLFRAGERPARAEVASFDTGAWSLYSARGAESTLSYHELLAGFLDGLCKRLDVRVYCNTAADFHRYVHEPTRIGVAPLFRLSARRTAEVRFTLSKISNVKVRVWGARGMSLSRDLELPRGSHELAWQPPGRGRYRLRIEAQGPSGPLGVTMRTLKVKLPRPVHHKKRKRRRDRTDGAVTITTP